MILGQRTAREPAEVVIWGASALLSILLGTGCAYILWGQLHETARQGLLMSAVAIIGAGIVLIGLSSASVRIRVVAGLFAASLVFAFFSGGVAFAHLAH
jgi:hypothetical protein